MREAIPNKTEAETEPTLKSTDGDKGSSAYEKVTVTEDPVVIDARMTAR